jgi:hypothetical protein
MAELRNPRPRARKPTSSTVSLISPILRSVAPIIAGINKRKDNRAALTGSIPKILEIAIVEPERETPGSIANPWKNHLSVSYHHNPYLSKSEYQ